jgi:ribosomal protein S21
MATNIQIDRNANENSLNLLKRFTRKVQSSGVLSRVRSLRYADRQQSKYSVKKQALKTLARREETALLIKLGKMVEKVPGRR